jgi:hypothetical protein
VDADQLTIARGKAVNFNARLSLVGGIVDEKFDDAFGSATTSGLYDRFLFGQWRFGGAIEENADTVGKGQKRRLIRLAGEFQ